MVSATRPRTVALESMGIERCSALGPQMLSVAVSSGVLAAVVLMDDERVLPYLRDYAGQFALARVGTPPVDSWVSQRRPTADRQSDGQSKTLLLNVRVCQ